MVFGRAHHAEDGGGVGVFGGESRACQNLAQIALIGAQERIGQFFVAQQSREWSACLPCAASAISRGARLKRLVIFVDGGCEFGVIFAVFMRAIHLGIVGQARAAASAIPTFRRRAFEQFAAAEREQSIAAEQGLDLRKIKRDMSCSVTVRGSTSPRKVEKVTMSPCDTARQSGDAAFSLAGPIIGAPYSCCSLSLPPVWSLW